MKLSQLFLQIFLIATCWNQLTAVIFHCNFFQTNHLPLYNVYVCFLNRIEEVKNLKLTSIVGEHRAKKAHVDVTLLKATKIDFDYVPQNVENFFPHLIGFFLYNTGIKRISLDDFKPFPSLIYLMMGNCALEEIPNGVFDNNSKINYLNFNMNKLKSVGSKVLASVPNLEYANFEKNICVDAKAENAAQLDFLKSKMAKCYKNESNKDSSTVSTIISSPKVVPCPPPNCKLTKDKEIERLNTKFNDLKKENANLRREIWQLKNNVTSPCQQIVQEKPARNEIKSLEKEIAALKFELAQKKVTVKSFKDELVKKSAELKADTDNSMNCKQKLESVTKALSEVNEKCKYYEGNSENVVKNFDKMSRGECVEALKDSLSDKESCGSENEYLMDLISQTNSLEISCDISAWNAEGNSCNAVNFKCVADNQKIKKVINKDQTSFDETKINELLVLNQHALFLPYGIGEVLTNLIKMTLTNSHLTKLNSDALNLSNLKVLSFAANKISEIYNSDLSYLEKLEMLDLSANQIKKVNYGALDKLVELKTLKLNGNGIEEIDVDLFAKNIKLTSILLQDNRLKFVGSETFTSLTTLKIVDFSDNICVKEVYTEASIKKLNQILSNHCGKPTRLCCRFEKLSEQDVSCRADEFTLKTKSTKLSSVKSLDGCIIEDSLIDPRNDPREGSENVDDVTILEIIDQTVYYLPSNLAELFPRLLKLVVVNSKLKSLTNHDLNGFQFINFIKVSTNELTSLEPYLFKGISTVQHLDISNNQLKKFPPKFFEDMTRLIFLNASSNELEKLEAELFSKKNSLEEIYFDRNYICDVDPKLFRNLKNAKIIDFTNNPCIALKYPDDIDMKDLFQKAAYC